MELVVLKNKNEVAKFAADLVAKAVRQKPNLALGLATGKTTIPFYKELVKFYRRGKVDFSRVRTFNLDEYVGRNDFRVFMDKHFFSKVNIVRGNINFLDGLTSDLREECAKYERAIRSCGRVDLQILGIGKNGHIGFNEPGSVLKSRTRLVELSLATRRANFGSLKNAPREALTMGIGTILEARKILLLAFGKEKKNIVRKALRGKITPKAPASFLRRHKNCLVAVDESAAP